MENTMARRFRTKAAFLIKGARNWSWIKWDHNDPSKHSAIIDKAAELGAVGWDFGQADHFPVSEWPLSR